MKKLLYFFSILSVATLASVNYYLTGLDNNSKNNIDLTLETPSTEEYLFSNVADLIQSFVVTQKKIRENIPHLLNSNFISSSKRSQYKKVLEDLPNKGNYATRDVHRKTHGCYDAVLKINSDIKEKINAVISKTIKEREHEAPSSLLKNRIPELINSNHSLGLFQPSAKYNAVVRLSNGHPQNRHDKKPDARGFAVKLLPKEISLKSSNSETINSNTLLDIVTINFPTFFTNGASKYLAINKWFLKSGKDNHSIFQRIYEGISVFGVGLTRLEKKLALKVNGSVIAHPLYEDYFSMVASRLGNHGEARAVKYVWTPTSCKGENNPEYYNYFKPDWTVPHNYVYPITGDIAVKKLPPYKENQNYWNHYYLRDRIENTLKKDIFCYDLHVQLYRDQSSTNIEDSTDIWISSEKERKYWQKEVVREVRDEEYTTKIKNKKLAPRIKIGQLQFNKLDHRSKVQNTKQCEDLSFNPWNGAIEFHKPLSAISRMKQKVYNAVRKMRHRINNINTEDQERK